jgi:hypothetical protein
MKIIGNIVSNKIIDFDPRIKTVGTIDEIIDGLPTLIIGWELSKELFPEEFDILNSKIKEKFFWTYTLIEKRTAYEIDTDNFIQHCYDNIVSDLNYVFVDPILFKLSTMKKTINKIKSINNPISYIHNNFIYMYGDNIIFGVDLGLLESFFDIDKEKVKNKIQSISNGLLLDDTILIEYKDYLGRINDLKYIPYLYHIEHG